MKLVSFEQSTPIGKIARIGILVNGDRQILDAEAALSYFLHAAKEINRPYDVARSYLGGKMTELIAAGKGALSLLYEALDYFKANDVNSGINSEKLYYDLADVKLLPPLEPASIRDGLNCLSHFENLIKNKVKNITEIPALFTKRPFYYRGNHFSISGPNEVIDWPSYGSRMDYELEVFAIIGKAGINIKKEDAWDHIFGYTIFNDFTARNQQLEDGQTTLGPSKCKCFTGSNVIGPCIVTADEVDPNNLEMEARINGEVWSHNNTKEMVFKFDEMIEYMSRDEMLFPGECIASGTMSNGAGQEMGRQLPEEAVVELEVDGIGILQSTLRKPQR